MKQERSFPAVRVTKKAETSLRAGHPWVYDTEIISCELENSDENNGSLCDVLSEKGSYLGTGFISFHSKIRLRLLSSDANERFDEAFFVRRVRYAIDYRRTVMGEDFPACRLIFGEADGLPGLTIDNYNGLLVSQVLSVGTEKKKDIIYNALTKVLPEYGLSVKGLFERNDVAIRELEGMKQEKGWYEALSHPESAVTEINENGIYYSVDVENGQKTGFFLDQKYNRLAAAKIAKGKRVLDCCTHTGSFALNAAKGGAEHVTAVDVSQSALDLAKANAIRNGLDDRMDFVCADIFELLPELCEKHADYGLVILDPPAFTKSRKTISSAEGGYKQINYRAMKLLPRGGYLATCSCSHFMESDMFLKALRTAATEANVSLKLVEARRQSPDHPTLMSVPETDYLKFYIFQIV